MIFPRSPHPLSLSRQHVFIIGLALLAVAFLTHAPCLSSGFVNWDDQTYTTNNPDITNFDLPGIGKIFTSFVVGGNYHIYHPLTILSFCADYALFKNNPVGYHFTNLLWHSLSTIILFLLILKLTRQPFTALITAVLFTIHPLNVEPVAWISARKDVLYVFFYLLALLCYAQHIESAGKKRVLSYITALVFFAAALLSKPTAVTLPLVLIGIDCLRQPFSFGLIWRKIPFLLLATILTGVISWQKYTAPVPGLPQALYERISLGSYAILQYVQKIFVPLELSALYPYPDRIAGELPPHVLSAPYVLGGMITILLMLFRKSKIILFGALFFLIGLLPVAGFIPIGDYLMADRYVYLPSVGIFLVLAHAWNQAHEKFNIYRKQILRVLTLIMVLGLVTLSFLRCLVWQNSKALWHDALQKFPAEWRIFNNLGDAYLHAGDEQAARRYLQEAIYLYPGNFIAYNALGAMAFYHQQDVEAAAYFRKAIQLAPDHADAYNNLGHALRRINDLDSAIHMYRQAHRLNPGNLTIQLNLARGLFAQGQTEQAAAIFADVYSRYPNELDSVHALVAIYLQLEQRPKAEKLTAEILRKDTQVVRLTRLASLWAVYGDNARAEMIYRHAQKLDPQEPAPYLEMGKLYAAANQLDEAIAIWTIGQQINPGDTRFPDLIAKIRNLKSADKP